MLMRVNTSPDRLASVVAVLATLLCGWSWAAASQQADVPGDAPRAVPTALRSGIDLVALQVTVEDDGRKPVCNLSADDFAVFEDGAPQVVTTFATAAAPLDLVLLVDTSGSMNQRTPAAYEAVPALFGALRRDDRASVVLFDDEVHVAQALTDDINGLERVALGAPTIGGTALRDAIGIGLDTLVRERSAESLVRRQALVIVSDGEDTASTNLSLDDVLSMAGRSGVTLFTVVPRQMDPTGLRRMLRHAQIAEAELTMRSLARITGGRAFFDVTAVDLAETSRQIAGELNCQYWLGYEPTRLTSGYRRIAVTLRRFPRLRARTRSGYDASASPPRMRVLQPPDPVP